MTWQCVYGLWQRRHVCPSVSTIEYSRRESVLYYEQYVWSKDINHIPYFDKHDISVPEGKSVFPSDESLSWFQSLVNGCRLNSPRRGSVSVCTIYKWLLFFFLLQSLFSDDICLSFHFFWDVTQTKIDKQVNGICSTRIYCIILQILSQ